MEITDFENKQCRLKCKESHFLNGDCNRAYILIPHWFKSSIYKIKKIEKGYIYFTAPDLAISYNKGYNVNDDYNYGKSLLPDSIRHNADRILKTAEYFYERSYNAPETQHNDP